MTDYRYKKGDFILFNERGGITDVGRVVTAGTRQAVVEQWHSDSFSRIKVDAGGIVRLAKRDEVRAYISRKQLHLRRLVEMYTQEAEDLDKLIELYK